VRRVLTAAVVLLVPRAVLACPVCFGQNDSPMASAISYGVIAMLGVVVAVLGAFASFIVYLSQRARLASDSSSNPQEGTV
jgi:hypothetical protein